MVFFSWLERIFFHLVLGEGRSSASIGDISGDLVRILLLGSPSWRSSADISGNEKNDTLHGDWSFKDFFLRHKHFSVSFSWCGRVEKLSISMRELSGVLINSLRFLVRLCSHIRESFLYLPAIRFSLPYFVTVDVLCSHILPSFLNIRLTPCEDLTFMVDPDFSWVFTSLCGDRLFSVSLLSVNNVSGLIKTKKDVYNRKFIPKTSDIFQQTYVN